MKRTRRQPGDTDAESPLIARHSPHSSQPRSWRGRGNLRASHRRFLLHLLRVPKIARNARTYAQNKQRSDDLEW